MLISFSVENFWSVRERQELVMIAAASDHECKENVVYPRLPSMQDEGILKGAAIYGANAAGKSNILRAVKFAQGYVRGSATQKRPGDSTERVPFLLDPSYNQRPTRFEFDFEYESVRYVYIFALDDRDVLEEKLVSFAQGKPRMVFDRRADRTPQYRFPRNAAFYRTLEAKTRANALFLSVAVQFNADELLPVYDWFRNRLAVVRLTGRGLRPFYTAKKLTESPDLEQVFVSFLRAADIGVEGIKVHERGVDESPLSQDLSGLLRTDIKDEQSGDAELRFYDVQFMHKDVGASKSVAIPLSSESDGTQRLFSLLWPINDVLTSGKCLLLDEIESSMHPLVCRKIISLMLGKRNTSGAQLIYTTHNTDLLDSKILRRDQIWFVDKDSTDASRLYPLTDFSPRKDELLQKGYMAGRYGAIPDLGTEFEIDGPA